MAKENLIEARDMWRKELNIMRSIPRQLPQDLQRAKDAIERLNKEIADADAADGLAG